MLKPLVTLSFLVFAHSGFAQTAEVAGLYALPSQLKIPLEALVASVTPGTVIIASEEHDQGPHHQNQVALIQALEQRGLIVHVGMEFLEYPHQDALDQFLRGQINEADFLKQVLWGGNPFSDYREQVLEPSRAGGWTWAINAPRSVSGKVAKSGLGSLAPDEQALLPPGLQRGNDKYFKRFHEVMANHVPEDAIERYFWAQSLWDDTMAWKTSAVMSSLPQAVIVIIVGDFHAIYGGGLPERLKARGINQLITISQVSEQNLNSQDPQEILAEDPEYGFRADYVWITPLAVVTQGQRSRTWVKWFSLQERPLVSDPLWLNNLPHEVSTFYYLLGGKID